MSTLAEIVFSVLDGVKPENLTSGPITEELVKFHIKNVRAQLAKQQLGKNNVLPTSYVQSLGCITLVEADKSECCAYPTGCIILKTNVPIPNQIDGRTNLLTRVGPVDITERSFQYIEYERVPFEGYNKYTKHLIKWFTNHNSNYIYLLMSVDDYLTKSLEVINIQGILENPEDASSFMNCSTGTVCFSDKSKYPIPDSMLPTLIEMVIKKFVLPQAQAPIDSTNDNKENSQTTISKGA